MSNTTTTNIRVGPGVYMALKEMAEKSGLTIGTCANLLVALTLYNVDKSFSGFRPETQKALTADILAAFSEIFKMASLESVRNTSIADLYQNLFGQPEDK
jgi:hypothetical protein